MLEGWHLHWDKITAVAAHITASCDVPWYSATSHMQHTLPQPGHSCQHLLAGSSLTGQHSYAPLEEYTQVARQQALTHNADNLATQSVKQISSLHSNKVCSAYTVGTNTIKSTSLNCWNVIFIILFKILKSNMTPVGSPHWPHDISQFSNILDCVHYFSFASFGVSYLRFISQVFRTAQNYMKGAK